MKKIFALLFSLGIMTAVMAQGGRRESRDVVLGQQNRSVYNHDRRYDHFSARERDQAIERVKREYRWRIESVRRERHMRQAEKRREIRFLENERDAKIRAIWKRYNERNQRNYGRRY
jgi:hypothetical protein